MKRVLVCGDRNWSNYGVIANRLRELSRGTLIISGGARGADTLACLAAKALGFAYVEVRADWERHGKAAGAIRNREMLKLKPDLVIAFHDDLTKSKGTADMLRIARAAGIPTEERTSND